MPPEETSPLDSLRERVYRPEEKGGAQVPAYSHEEAPAAYGWQAPPPPAPKKRLPWTIKFLIATGVFLVIAGAVAAFLIFHGTRAISSDRVKIEVQAPVSIASGDTVPVVITVHNGNPTTLKDAMLYASFPDGTRAGDGTDAQLTQYSDALGDVSAGADVTRTVQVKLFGTEGQDFSVPLKVEYHTDGSNALFVSRDTFDATVSTSPISVQVQTLSQSPSGQPLTLSVSVRSNASSPVSNVALAASYPSGFSPTAADPKPSAANFFDLGTLDPGAVKTIKVTGTLTGETDDQRVFRFTAGSTNPDGSSTLGNSYAEGDATVTITHPFLNVGLSLNNSSSDTVVAEPGSTMNALVSWQNMLSDPLTNASIHVAVSGSALASGSISGGSGFYRSSDSSVVFDSSTNPELASLAAGDTGVGSFSFALKPTSALAGVASPTVTLTVSVSGQHASQGAIAQTLTSTQTRTIKVGSTVSLSSALSRSASDTGPIPPAAGTESTYTVTLTAKNSVSSVGAAKETFTLPSYVRFMGAADSGITFNPDTHTVTWGVGDLAAGASASGTFQIGFTPSASQSGDSPTVIGEQSFTGVDRFTGAPVTATAAALTSELPGSRSSGTVQ